MEKAEVVEAVLLVLQEEFRSLVRASEEARSGASDEETQPDGKYDTQSTEANYLADGQARQAAAVEEAAVSFEGVDFRDFDPKEPVEVGALVQLDLGGEEGWFLLGPAAGGTEVRVEGIEVTVVTPEAPLGGALLGRRAGDSIERPAATVVSVG
jgi:transcription elongation GreA/GreB family factor